MPCPPGRIDLHTHSLLSDGALLPSELLRRAAALGYSALALTDHVDASNLSEVLGALLRFAQEQGEDFPLRFIAGVELTHIAPQSIGRLARRAKELGAQIVVVHGESPVEPVAPGTNRAALECPEVDILAHPGFITLEEVQLAQKNSIYLELTSRQGHSLTNGLVARLAQEAGAKLVVNTDAHEPQDMIDQQGARRIALGAGLDEGEAEQATVGSPEALVKRALARRLVHI